MKHGYGDDDGDEYDDDEEDFHRAVDSDDDNEANGGVSFVPAMKKFKYTTFGADDDDNDDDENDDDNDDDENGMDGKDAATYGVFMESAMGGGLGFRKGRSEGGNQRTKAGSGSSPMFVKATQIKADSSEDKKKDGEDDDEDDEMEDGNNNDRDNDKESDSEKDQKDNDKGGSTTTSPKEQQGKDETEAKQKAAAKAAEEERKKKQDEANNKFYALLGRGRGEKRKRFQQEKYQQEDSTASTGMGLGFHAAAGSAGAGGSEQAKTNGSAKSANDPETEDSIPFIGFGGRNRMRPPSPPARIDPNLGKWEKHTKGIGLKLLSKMGYKGSGGLGSKRRKEKEGTSAGKGISRPVEVVVRPNNLGLGFGNFKEASNLKANKQIEAEIRGEEPPDEKKKKKQQQQAEEEAKRKRQSQKSSLPSTRELMQQQNWKRGSRGGNSAKKRPRRNIVPYEQILREKQASSGAASGGTTIIDMTGASSATPKEGGAGASSSSSTTPGQVPLAEELLHNVSLLLNTHETKLHASSHFVTSSKRKLDSLESDLAGMKKRKEETQNRISKMEAVLTATNKIDALMQKMSDGMEDKIRSLLSDLREKLSDEDRELLRFDEVLVPSLLQPLATTRLESWKPLRDDPATTASVIRSVLNLGSNLGNDDATAGRKRTAFVSDVIPVVQNAYDSIKWNPITDADQGLSAFETLLDVAREHSPPLLSMEDENDDPNTVLPTLTAESPSSAQSLTDLLLEQVIKNTVAPKLMRALNQWQPALTHDGQHLQDRLDAWILPWMPYLDHPSILLQLTTDVRRKVRSALSFLKQNLRHVDDETFTTEAIATLRPWGTILKPAFVHDLSSKYITPRLSKYLRGCPVDVDPTKQDWSHLDLVLNMYRDKLLSLTEFLSLVEADILYLWADQLYKSLSKSGQAGLDHARLYTVWKQKILFLDKDGQDNGNNNSPKSSPTLTVGELLRRDDTVVRVFYSGLRYLTASIEDNLDELPTPPTSSVSYREVVSRRNREQQEQAAMDLHKAQSSTPLEYRRYAVGHRNGDGEMATFQEVVEDLAQEHDVSFRPRVGGKSTTQDGKPIYLFGDVPIYLDSNVVFALRQSQWTPVSLETLVSYGNNAAMKQ